MLSACVVNYNGESCLNRCLSALRQARGVEEVIVVDGASTDRSAELVRASFPEARLVQLSRNAGPSAARNAGYRAARHDLVLFVDNDVFVPPNVATALTEALATHGSAALAVPRLLHDDAPHLVQFDGADSHFIGSQTLHHAERRLDEAPTALRVTDTSLVSACFLVDRRRWGDVALFDESFFIYFEDHDLGFRCRAFGHTIVSVPEVQCLHGSGTVGVSLRQLGAYSDLRVRSLIRNRWQHLAKNYQAGTLIVLAPLLLLYEVAQVAIVAKKGWLRHWTSSLLWLARHAPDLMTRRREVQRRRTVPDREILRGGSLPFASRLATSGGERIALRALDTAARGYWRAARRLI
jgi:GT2 family glycosyltransferase